MAKSTVARCSIYEKRPEVCKVYPTVTHYIPSECTYYFAGAERRGSCDCGIGACCATPRENGEPGGTPLPDIAGGMPCKYLEYIEKDDGKPDGVEKTAAETEVPRNLAKELGLV
jgi:hypothetical protein